MTIKTIPASELNADFVVEIDDSFAIIHNLEIRNDRVTGSGYTLLFAEYVEFSFDLPAMVRVVDISEYRDHIQELISPTKVSEMVERYKNLSVELGEVIHLMRNFVYDVGNLPRFNIHMDTSKMMTLPDFGVHECESEDNPVGICMYFTYTDPSLDNCLYCHQPHERK